MSKLILYISCSLDGFLAPDDDDLTWLNAVMVEGEDYGYQAFTAGVSSYLVGRKTYDVVVGMLGEFPQAKQYDCYVITRQELPPERGVTFYNGDLSALVHKLKAESEGNIYCDGGGQLVKLLLDEDLIDEFIISVIPTILGAGKRLFPGGSPPRNIQLIEHKGYPSGLVQLRYQRVRKVN